MIHLTPERRSKNSDKKCMKKLHNFFEEVFGEMAKNG